MVAALVLCLLGGFEARLQSGAPLNLSTKTGQAMLAYLALTPEQRHSREKLAALLWDEQARTSLRQTLAVLRKAIPSTDRPWLLTDADWVALDRDAVQSMWKPSRTLPSRPPHRALRRPRICIGRLARGVQCSRRTFLGLAES
jgi:hypothetical protein